MDPSDIVRLLNSDHYSPAILDEVNDLCRNYPMFNLAHMLKVRIREALGRDKDAELRMAAIYAGDRRRLYELVTEVHSPELPGPEEVAPPQEPLGIQFSEEPNEQADVIIRQHAPYAGPVREPQSGSSELLELDEEMAVESFALDGSMEGQTDVVPGSVAPETEAPASVDPAYEGTLQEEEFSSETIIQAFVKEETEMEEPGPGTMETPIIDKVEPHPAASASRKLIDTFINESPGPIRADKRTTLKGDVSLSSIREHDGFITDTLAKIYVKQGLYAKAIYAYEKLSLKYPEKSAYFAAQIEKIKNINHS